MQLIYEISFYASAQGTCIMETMLFRKLICKKKKKEGGLPALSLSLHMHHISAK